MSKIQIGSLAFKLSGIFAIIQAMPLLRHITEVLAFKNTPYFDEGTPFPTNYMLFGIITSISLLVLTGLILLSFSNYLSEKIFWNSNEEITPENEITSINIQSVAFSVAGIVLIVIAIPNLIQLWANILILASMGDQAPKESISAGTWAYSAGLAAQMLAGVLLFLGSRGLSSLWYFLQKTRPMSKINMRT